MAPNDIIELAPLDLSDEEIDPLEVIDHIAIVEKGKKVEKGYKLRILRIQHMEDDDTQNGQVVRQETQVSKGKKAWKTAILQKQGVFAGSVRVLERCTVGDTVIRPVAVRIDAIDANPLKALEKAIEDPDLGADWTPYLVTLDNDATLPARMRVLIIKWRPTKKRTRRVLEIVVESLCRAGMIIGIHYGLSDAGLMPGDAMQGFGMAG